MNYVVSSATYLRCILSRAPPLQLRHIKIYLTFEFTVTYDVTKVVLLEIVALEVHIEPSVEENTYCPASVSQ